MQPLFSLQSPFLAHLAERHMVYHPLLVTGISGEMPSVRTCDHSSPPSGPMMRPKPASGRADRGWEFSTWEHLRVKN